VLNDTITKGQGGDEARFRLVDPEGVRPRRPPVAVAQLALQGEGVALGIEHEGGHAGAAALAPGGPLRGGEDGRQARRG
jgi:hypothetical protein